MFEVLVAIALFVLFGLASYLGTVVEVHAYY